MKKQLHGCLLAAAAILSATGSHAHDVEIDGVCYDLDESAHTARVTYPTKAPEAFPAPTPTAYKGSIRIPASIHPHSITYAVTSIADSAFFNQSALTDITIPASVTSVGKDLFVNCSQLTSVLVDAGNPAYSSVDGILYDKDRTCLLACPAKKEGELTIPASVTSIAGNAFRCCVELHAVTVPNSVTSIGDFAFDSCYNLHEITLSRSVTSLGRYTFYLCRNLNSVTLPEALTSIGDHAFCGCSSLTGITLPASMTSIGDYALSGCGSLTELTIPEALTSIGDCAFSGCSSLTAIHVAESNPAYCAADGLLYDKGKTTLLVCPGKKAGTLTLPQSLTNIADGACSGCDNLTAVTLPHSVKSIGKSAFAGCSSLATFTFPGSVTEIGDRALAFCSSLTTVSIPASATSIGKEVFSYCNELTTVYSAVDISVFADDKPFQVKENGSIYVLPRHYTPYASLFGSKTVKPTGAPVHTATCGKSTQTTLSFTLNASAFEAQPDGWPVLSVVEKGIRIGDDRHPGEVAKEIVVEGLRPNKSYAVCAYTKYDDGTICEHPCASVRTNGLHPRLTCLLSSPTAYAFAGSCTVEDAHLSETGFVTYTTGDALLLTGLTPETKYSVAYYVKTQEGSEERTFKSFTTPALELTTQQPGGVTATCAIGTATTNISDKEPGVGFQWKRSDAPESLAPSEGQAVVCHGQMEGYIKDLEPDTYYKVRAFYKTSGGTYHYGEWVTFTTADATGIGCMETTVPTVVGYYDLHGRRLGAPAKGIHLVRYSDGTTRKVIRK